MVAQIDDRAEIVTEQSDGRDLGRAFFDASVPGEGLRCDAAPGNEMTRTERCGTTASNWLGA
jgi:hypothetical protein